MSHSTQSSVSRSTVIALLVLLLTAQCLRAEPTRSVEWLMNEPVSLFDLGMQRMRFDNKFRWQPELSAKVEGKGITLEDSGVGSVVYSWDKNEISVTASFQGQPSEELCVEVLAAYKKIILYGSGTTDDYKYSKAAGVFGHINYSTGGRPKDLDKNIAKMFRYTVGISEGQLGKSIYCTVDIDSDIPTFIKFRF